MIVCWSTQRCAPTRREEDARIWRAFQQRARTFSLSARLLRSEVRLPVATLYGYCRAVDTIADQHAPRFGMGDALRRLEATRSALEETLADRPPNQLLWRRLAEVHRQFCIPEEPLFELLDGAVWDVRGGLIDTENDLITYAQKVAGSVGVMMLPFLVSHRAEVDRLTRSARSLGVAMQLTNILRDVGEDLRDLDRIYLPATLREKYGVSREDILRSTHDGTPSPAYMCLAEHVMGMAEQHYRQAQPGIRSLPRRSGLAIRAAARMYREILNEVRAAGYDNLARRNAVDLSRKLVLVARDDYGRRKEQLLLSLQAS